MQVIFAGPSIYGASLPAGHYQIRPPARQGDLLGAVEDGATAIGLIDGVFGSSGSVWHKEILLALSRGVAVYGASSMGALRAAECARYGMVPVGAIAQDYCEGRLDDDAAVALLMGPAEMGYMPLVEPLVDIWPTLRAMQMAEKIGVGEAMAIRTAAEAIYFQDRTVEEIAARALPIERRQQFVTDYNHHRVSQKMIDALVLIDLFCQGLARPAEITGWTYRPSPFALARAPAG
jgi:hypothetical protein